MHGGADVLSVVAVVGALAGCASGAVTTVQRGEPRAPSTGEDPAATADTLLGAWFGCAMGETWTAALDTPPHAFSVHDLSRCHAVGSVVDAPAARLRAFVPDAVAAVSRLLDEKFGESEGLSGAERAEGLALFELGTDALKELAEANDVATAIRRDRAEDARAEAAAARLAEAHGRTFEPPPRAAYEPTPYRPRMVRLSRADRLAALHAFASGGTELRARQASVLAWMILLVRVEKALAIPVDLRRADLALALEAVAGVARPNAFTPRTTTLDEWLEYVQRAASTVGTFAPRSTAGLDAQDKRAVEAGAHAALVQGLARRLHDAASPLPPCELRRAALGAAAASGAQSPI